MQGTRRASYGRRQTGSSTWLLPDAQISDRQKRYCRCELHVAARQPRACNQEQAWFQKRDGKTCYNPYAVCTASVGRDTNECTAYLDFEALPEPELIAWADLHQPAATSPLSTPQQQPTRGALLRGIASAICVDEHGQPSPLALGEQRDFCARYRPASFTASQATQRGQANNWDGYVSDHDDTSRAVAMHHTTERYGAQPGARSWPVHAGRDRGQHSGGAYSLASVPDVPPMRTVARAPFSRAGATSDMRERHYIPTHTERWRTAATAVGTGVGPASSSSSSSYAMRRRGSVEATAPRGYAYTARSMSIGAAHGMAGTGNEGFAGRTLRRFSGNYVSSAPVAANGASPMPRRSTASRVSGTRPAPRWGWP